MTASTDYDTRYLAGIDHFNACDFFEAHEVWEELWADCRGPSRRFFQGLIQAAVCLHHFGNGNLHGATKLFHSCRRYLDEYAPHYCGLDLKEFLRQLEQCCAEILVAQGESPEATIDPEKIPEIALDPPAASE